MATPRKHWFKVADSVGVEPWTNDVLATFIRLQAALNTRWARDGRSAAEASGLVCRPGELMALTGTSSLVRARRIMHELATHISITIKEDRKNTSLNWPKWPQFQDLAARESPENRTDSPSPKSAGRKTQFPPKSPEGGLEGDGRNRNPRRRLRDQGIPADAIDRVLQALELEPNLSLKQKQFIARTPGTVEQLIQRLHE